jgi:RNA polymerase sigma-70 factor (ECF subfamily)
VNTQRPGDCGAGQFNGPAEEEAALANLQQVHAPVLLAFLTRIAQGDAHLAEEIAQETLLRAWCDPQARNAEGRWSRAWLFTMAKRIVIDQRRAIDARPAEPPADLVEAHPVADDPLERLLDAWEVQAALGSLPERMRSTLVEIFFRERSVTESADVLDVSTGTVRSRTVYGLRELREALLSRGFDFGPGPDVAELRENSDNG